ncbi:MAG: bifunctional folylpolyglutamate synthase/dihydrofolate synthase [Nitrospinae bacterium]|nr:bifunctional folylpolyglutamate synthase/dihydrofolate synthase [Nitrospinota bacterium]
MTFAEAERYLNSLSFKGIRLGLANTNRLLKLLGDPHKSFDSVHVTGTNGKGSTSTLISNILTRAGVSNGLYVSPHLETFRERISVNGSIVTTGQAAALVEKVRGAVERDGKLEVTYFEFMTAMAFLHFAQCGVKIAVVEVGLGGRFDSTNVLSPAVSVITSVSMDHREYLGNTLAAIAREKCGIVKKRTPLVTAASGARVIAEIMKDAKAKRSPVYLCGREFSGRRTGMTEDGECFDFQSSMGEVGGMEVSLVGRPQVLNGSMAIQTALLLLQKGVNIGEKAIRAGLSTVSLPGRFEIARRDPLVILDGAHNPKATSALCRTLLERFPERGIDFVFGAMKDKDYRRMLRNLSPAAKSFTFYSPPVPRAADPVVFKKAMGASRIPFRVARSLDDVIKTIVCARKNSVTCVTGSFYTIGEIRPLLRKVFRK